uniref:Sensory neuron membrane protein 2 n=1 Tax=Colaphellus bowringi TaxID=561076 RepID=A0A0S3J3G0_9CUCU|nr:sensory neuron membrane protein SNMP3 [Colaphellus bowringi]
MKFYSVLFVVKDRANMLNKFNITVSGKIIVILGVFGLFCIFAGFYVGFKAVPDVITDKIWDMKVLKENTEQWGMFMKTPFPFTFKVYLFDVQNPQEILQGAKPVLRETGPFVYKVYKWKSEVEWDTPDDISYFSYMRFEFDRKASGIFSEDMKVTLFNTAYYGMLQKIDETQPEVLSTVEGVLPSIFGENHGLFIKVKVKDYLFDGLKICENEGKDGGFVAGMVCKQMIARLPESKNLRLEDNSILFSNMHYKNNTHQGRFTVKSGGQNRTETATLTLFNGKSYISSWTGEKSMCNKIRGATTVFPVNIEKNMTFEAYSEDICRTIPLEYSAEETVKDIVGYKFSAMNDSFSSTKKENFCYCTNTTRTLDGEYGCLKDGVTDLKTCIGSSILVSFPHLLYGDEEYLDSVIGLNPEKSKHETTVILEPISGFPLSVTQRIQFNTFLRPIDNVISLENVSKSLFPLLWVEESLILDDQYTDMLKNELFRTIKIVDIVKWVTIGSGAACVLIALILRMSSKTT